VEPEMTPEQADEMARAFIRRNKESIEYFNGGPDVIEARVDFLRGRLEDVSRIVLALLADKAKP
jgi:3-dehydroquinate dehydratase